MKKISVVVPIYNVEKYLKECLDSIVNQDMPLTDYEVILVNDGSTDDSRDIAKEYALRYENVSYFEQENQGQSVARNLGIEKAVGEYIMFVDSDDCLLENVLDGIYSEAKRVDADICVGAVRVMQKDGSFIEDRDIRDVSVEAIKGRDALLDGMILGSVWARVYRRGFLVANNARFPADMKHEDVFFNLSLLPFADKVFTVDDVIYFYRWNGNSTDRSITELSIFKGLLGDLNVAGLAKRMSYTFRDDNELSNYMRKLSSSLVVSNIYSLYTTNRHLDKSLKNDYLHKAKEMSLLPIEMDNLSLKSSIIALLINVFLCE